MKRTRISDLIEYIEPSKGDRRMVCSGIIVHTSPKVVIDTNFGHPETADFLSRERPQVVILTHYHADHSGVGRVSADMGAHLFIPAGEEAYLKDIENYSGLIAPNDQVMRLALEQRLRNGRYRELDSQGYSLYDDATDFGLEQRGLMQAISSPGHSPDHHSFYFPQEKVLFPGDVGLDAFGPWYAFPNCDVLMYVESLRRLMTLDIDHILTSHNGVISGDVRGALGNCIRRICERESMIVRKLEAGCPEQQIIEEGVIYDNRKGRRRDPIRFMQYRGDTVALRLHLRVIREGGIRRFFPDIDSVIG